MTLREQYQKETAESWINSQGEPDIDYVEWLEREFKSLNRRFDKLFGKYLDSGNIQKGNNYKPHKPKV